MVSAQSTTRAGSFIEYILPLGNISPREFCLSIYLNRDIDSHDAL